MLKLQLGCSLVAKRIAQSLDDSFRKISGDVIGNMSILFGDLFHFPPGQCCTDEKAFAGHPAKIDLVIALDESGSVGYQNFEIMKNFVEDLTSHFVVSYCATRVAVVTWLTRITLEFDFNEYINNEGVKKGIRKIKYSGGWTATGDALISYAGIYFHSLPVMLRKFFLFSPMASQIARGINQSLKLSF